MGRFTDKTHEFSIYDVPKGGGTTIRSWIHYKYKGNLGIEGFGNGYKSQSTKSYKHLNELGFRVECCYKDKILREGNCDKIRLDKFIGNVDKIIQKYDFNHTPKVKFLKYHFAPQHKILGDSKTIYNHVFDISEMDTRVKEYLEDMWKIKLPKLHCRNQSKRKYGLNLTKSQRKLLEDRYAKDYQIGWC
jgi:hypothetical protein